MSSPPTSPTFAASWTEMMSPSFMITLKPGCRGDPRMNRAVAAKLKNPSLSLYDALLLGGFNYPRNVDAATIDNDRVTLGQRKNQLNRRLRLARQHSQKTDADQDTAHSNSSPTISTSAYSVKIPTVTLGSTSPLAVVGSYLRQQRVRKSARKSGAKITAIKRAAPLVGTEEILSKKQCIPGVNASTATLIPATTDPTRMTDDETSFFHAPSQISIAENLSCGIGSVSTAAENFYLTSTPFGRTTATQPREEECHPRKSNTQDVTISFPEDSFGSQRSMGLNNQVSALPQTFKTGPGNMWSAGSVSNTCSDHKRNSHTLYTDLGHQCQAQQAMETLDPKEELALRIFSANLQSLYQKSMLASGFTLQESNQSSRTFHRFAFKAWKGECERLQVLLKDHVVAPQAP